MKTSGTLHLAFVLVSVASLVACAPSAGGTRAAPLLNAAWPWAVTMLSLVLAGLSGYNWYAERSAVDDHSHAVAEAIENLSQRLAGVASDSAASARAMTRSFREAPTSVAGRPAPPAEIAAPGRTASGTPRNSQLDLVLRAVDEWLAVAGSTSTFVDRQHQELRAIADDATRADAGDIVIKCRHLTRAVLNYDDDERLAHCEVQLKRLVEVAGLQLISPKVGDKYDDVIHVMAGSDRAPTSQDRKRVSTVKRRGLKANDAVFLKAEVNIYD